MTSPKLILGYSPYNKPYENPIYPFNEIYDDGFNLLNATDSDLKKCHALVLWGGADICTSFYREKPIWNSGPKEPTQRDLFEWELIRRFHEAGKPMIGVCRGAQMMCSYVGGKLIQNVSGHHSDHDVVTYTGEKFQTTSAHHQMMYPYDVDHELLAWCPKHLGYKYEPEDALYSMQLEQRRVDEPEVVWFPEIKGLAIQGHPEWHHRYQNTWDFNKWIENIILERFFE